MNWKLKLFLVVIIAIGLAVLAIAPFRVYLNSLDEMSNGWKKQYEDTKKLNRARLQRSTQFQQDTSMKDLKKEDPGYFESSVDSTTTSDCQTPPHPQKKQD